jgi:hypothetical protein
MGRDLSGFDLYCTDGLQTAIRKRGVHNRHLHFHSRAQLLQQDLDVQTQRSTAFHLKIAMFSRISKARIASMRQP